MWVNIWIWVCISVRIPCWECRWTKLVLTWDVKKPYLQKSLKQSTNRGILKLIICHATYIKYMNQWLDWLYYCLVCPTKYSGGLLPPSPPPPPHYSNPRVFLRTECKQFKPLCWINVPCAATLWMRCNNL